MVSYNTTMWVTVWASWGLCHKRQDQRKQNHFEKLGKQSDRRSWTRRLSRSSSLQPAVRRSPTVAVYVYVYIPQVLCADASV